MKNYLISLLMIGLKNYRYFRALLRALPKYVQGANHVEFRLVRFHADVEKFTNQTFNLFRPPIFIFYDPVR